ncbi:MAG: hypothetical protein WBL23_14340 [Salinisphaera sp.]
MAALVVLGWQGRRAERRLATAESRVRRLRAFQAEASALEAARGRFRRRQRDVENAVETGARGMESAHRSLAARLGWPTGAGVYRRLRGLNRSVGRGVSGLFAPATASRRRESLVRWRARRTDTSDRDDS